MNPTTQTTDAPATFSADGALVRGQWLRHCADPSRLAFFPENRAAMADLFRQYRIETLPPDMVDGWIAHGARGQLWEFGPDRLGFTIIGNRRIATALEELSAIASVTQRGDGEANFVCDWTPANLKQVARLLRLRRRYGAPQIYEPQAQNCSFPAVEPLDPPLVAAGALP